MLLVIVAHILGLLFGHLLAGNWGHDSAIVRSPDNVWYGILPLSILTEIAAVMNHCAGRTYLLRIAIARNDHPSLFHAIQFSAWLFASTLFTCAAYALNLNLQL